MKESAIARIRARTKPETRIYVRKNLDVAARVNELLKQKGWTQKDLAKSLGKTESEVSRWLSGFHNITLKSIAKMEGVLEDDIIVTADKTQPAATRVHYVTLRTVFTPNNPFQPNAAMQKVSSADFFCHTKEEIKYGSVA